MLEKMQEYLKNMQQQVADAKSEDTVENMTDIPDLLAGLGKGALVRDFRRLFR